MVFYWVVFSFKEVCCNFGGKEVKEFLAIVVMIGKIIMAKIILVGNILGLVGGVLKRGI